MTSDDVIQAVRNVVEGNLAKIESIVTNVNGGWEIWLQVEAALGLAFAIGNAGGNSSWAREQVYPAPFNHYRCDIQLEPAKGTMIFVEMKVQNDPHDNILARFKADIDKIRNNLDTSIKGKYIVVALAYMHDFDPAGLKSYTILTGGTLKIEQWIDKKWANMTGNPTSGIHTLASFKVL